jgi:hypothetical protein
MSASKGKFVIIKAANCGVCTGRLEPAMPALHKRFRSEGYDVVEYKIDQMRINKDKSGNPVYPESLGMVWWYPFMFYTDNKTFEEIKNGEDRRDKINIVNGSFTGDAYKLEENAPINFLDPNILINWVNSVATTIVQSPVVQPVKSPQREATVDSNPFIVSAKKKNILEINYCNVKIVPKAGRC